MQEQRELNLELELECLKERVYLAEEERDHALSALKDAKKEAEAANSRFTEAFTTQKIYTELDTVKKLVASTTHELKVKQREIELLKSDVESARKLEIKLSEKESQLNKLNEELIIAKNVKPEEWKKKIQQLEHQLDLQKESEAKVFESLVDVTKQLEQTKIALEESRHEVCSLRDKYDDLLRKNIGSKDCASRNFFKDSNPKRDTLEMRAQEGEIGKLRNELKLANNAEINSKKAMDDLAIALSEVATESTQMKMKLDATETELENARREIEKLRSKGRTFKEKYKTLLDESRKEAEKNKNTTLRLRQEAEETLQTWNEKESGLVGCIRAAEEEKKSVQQENIRLIESLRAADNTVRTVKDEKNKLRDILKQALKESNAAKEAANIANAENSTLKDCLTEKDDALDFLTREIDNLKANEAAAMENINELKRIVSESAAERDSESDDSSKDEIKKQNTMEKEKENSSSNSLTKALSFSRMKMQTNNKHNESDTSDEKNKEIDGEDEGESDNVDGGDLLKGSIFDEMESPGAETQKRKKSSSNVGEGENLTPDDLDQLNDFENGRISNRRRRLLRRFGDLLIRRRSYAEASR